MFQEERGKARKKGRERESTWVATGKERERVLRGQIAREGEREREREGERGRERERESPARPGAGYVYL